MNDAGQLLVRLNDVLLALPEVAEVVQRGAVQACALVAENFRQHRIVMGS